MKWLPIPLLLAFSCALLACTHVRAGAQKEQAKQLWFRNMAVVEQSVKAWKDRSGRYSPDELTKAIDFFETLTEIHSGNMSFIGPIPDESLQRAIDEWKAWYAAHGEHLRYDTKKRRVIVSD